MTSIAILEAVNTSYIPFNGQQILTAVAAGVTYVAMRQIVENIGIDWTGQSVKLRKMKDKFNCRDISMVAADGKIRKLLCIPLKKLNGWLFSINPEKVRADIRDKLIQYQEECFTVLHDYWTKGEAKNPRKKTTVEERTPLRDAVNLLVGKKGLRYDDAYNMVHQRFNIDSIDELELEQIPLAVEYLHRIALEGELLPSQNDLPLNMNKQFNDSELYDLVCLWSISLILKEDSAEILPALQLLGSDWARKMSGNLGMLTGFIERAGRLLQRESHHIATSTTPPINWRLELARMQKVLG